jgi:acyl carrier protein
MQAMTRVALVFSEVLGIPVETITDETSPENTPLWDSLNAMNLVVALEGAFNVRLSTKEIVSMRTVGMVRKVLRTKGIEDA